MRARFWILLSAVLFFAHNGFAALWDDPSAMPSYQSIEPFSSPDGKLIGSVDYAVYDRGNYNGIMDYVYAYQVFNDAGSTVGIDYFSVGLPSDVVPYAWCEPMGRGEPLGSVSSAINPPLQTSALYIFPAAIKAGEHSWTLLFTSDYAPNWRIGVVTGGASGGVNVTMPAPVPEPATLILLFSGAFMALRGRRKI